MYVVRRDIRNTSGRYSAGSVIEPAEIRNFTQLLHNKYVMLVDEHNYAECYEFFRKRFGVHLPSLPVVMSDEEICQKCEALKLDLKDDLTREEVIKIILDVESRQ